MDDFFLYQIAKEGKVRWSDGEYLERHRQGDSGYLLKLLGFELLLKAAFYKDKVKEDYSHNYFGIYCQLSKPLKQQLISGAQSISQIFDINERVEKLLKWYQYNFIQLRYPFQSYKDLSEVEYDEYSRLYAELGSSKR